MIVITMYNEDEILFLRTLYGVMRNISHLEGRKNSGTWGAGSWKKVGQSALPATSRNAADEG